MSDVYNKIKAAGAEPLAITNCLNFGSPKNPQVMGQFIECVKGIAHGRWNSGTDYPQHSTG